MKRYKVVLTKEEREQVEKLISSGITPARKLTRARILLKGEPNFCVHNRFHVILQDYFSS